jgi:hypothetical protein
MGYYVNIFRKDGKPPIYLHSHSEWQLKKLVKTEKLKLGKNFSNRTPLLKDGRIYIPPMSEYFGVRIVKKEVKTNG